MIGLYASSQLDPFSNDKNHSNTLEIWILLGHNSTSEGRKMPGARIVEIRPTYEITALV